MTIYRYQAKTADGRSVSGEVDAKSASEVASRLESQGYTLESISQIPVLQAQSSASDEDRRLFYERLNEALAQREALLVPLKAIVDEFPHSPGQRELQRLLNTLHFHRTGEELARDELTAGWLPLFFQGAAIHNNTGHLSDWVQMAMRASELQAQRRKILTYPLVLLALAIAVVGIICTTVVPIFASMYAEFQLNLPPPTRSLVFIAENLQNSPFRFLLIAVGITFAAYGLVRLWFRFALTTRLFGLFTAGNTANVNAMAIFTRTLAEMLSVDAPLPEALRVAGISCRHRHFKDAAEVLAAHAVTPHLSLASSRAATDFPSNVIYALQTGDKGTHNILMLRELSNLYSERVARRIAWSGGVVAPLGIVFVGGAVAFIAIALFAPLLNLITSLS